MKKFLINMMFVSILLIGCTRRDVTIINYEFIDSDYIEEEVDGSELLLSSYDEYQSLIDKYNLQIEIDEEQFNRYNYIVVFDNNLCDSEQEINSITYYEDNTLEILYNIHKICGLCAPHTDVYFYRINKLNSDVKIKSKYKKIKDEVCDPNVAYKPILYIYPEDNMYISIKLEHDNNIITSYPKYNDGWNVYVDKNGKIYYKTREYYALYWDEYNDNKVDFHEGFYVDCEDAINFLEEKLDYIGLTNREANEFIMYWLPIFEENKHSLVYFELTDERNNNNKLIIDPIPDSMLRINMHIKKINNEVDIKEQELVPFKRTGYTIVEWGGTIHKEG